MKKQIIVYPDQKMTDLCDQYYLAETYLDMNAIHDVIKGKYEVLEYPFQSDDEYLEANKYIVGLSERIIHFYGIRLNQYRNINFSDRQWTIIMCIWLRHFLFDLYYKYLKLDSVRNEDIYMVGIDSYPEEKSIAFIIRSDISSIGKNVYLWTWLAKAMGIECVYRSDVVKVPAVNVAKKGADLFADRLVRAVRHPGQAIFWLGKKLLHSQAGAEESGFKNIDPTVRTLMVKTLLPTGLEEKISRQSGGKAGYLEHYAIWNMGREIVSKYDKDIELRKEVLRDAFAPQTEFEKIAHAAVMEFLPIAYMEAFEEMYAQAVEITKDWNIHKFYSCYTSTELLDYCIALMIPRGIEINLMQHSAAYGGRPLLAMEECMYADYFLTWGWEGLRYDWLHAKVKPVAIVRQPVKATAVEVAVKEKILYTPNIGTVSDYGQGDEMGDYTGNSLRFIEALDVDIRRQLYIRYNSNDDFNNELVKRCKERFPEIHYETRSEKSFTDSVLESKYLISDYYGSTHIEALCLNKAFVMFDANRLMFCGAYFEEHVKPLRDAGVYLEDGLELAHILNQRKNDTSWLYTDEIQKIYHQYMEAFTRLNQDVEKIWADEIMA